MVPVYIPTRKITISVPRVSQKIAFMLNYKGLLTNGVALDDTLLTIRLAAYEPFRRCIARWQRGETPADTAMWDWISDNVTIEIKPVHVNPTERQFVLDNPFVPVLIFSADLSDTFAQMFKDCMPKAI